MKRVYPRWRGEHFSALVDCGTPLGLSPLARGTRLGTFTCMTLRPVYPRWRGEHSTNVSNPAHVGGLSPLARGTPWRSKFWWRNNRFIPAGAGNTTSWKLSICQTSVYPRWRGEHPGMAHRFRVPGGLSPLARGTPHIEFLNLGGTRFIPAGAGNTLRLSRFRWRQAVYPRWRGEHVIVRI